MSTDLQPFDTSEIPIINQAIRLAEEIRLGEGIGNEELMDVRSKMLKAAAIHLGHKASIVGYVVSDGVLSDGGRIEPFDGYIKDGKIVH